MVSKYRDEEKRKTAYTEIRQNSEVFTTASATGIKKKKKQMDYKNEHICFLVIKQILRVLDDLQSI